MADGGGPSTASWSSIFDGGSPDAVSYLSLTSADLLRARDLRPGMNLYLPLFDGGTLVHVAAVNVSTDGVVSADVDTRARDALKVWEVIARNRESRNNPARVWMRDYRQSGMTKDALDGWDEVGGELYVDVDLPANKWTVFPVVAGQEGTIQKLRINTGPNAEFCVAIFGDRVWPGTLRQAVGNPLTKAGTKRWSVETVRDALKDRLILYVAGDYEQPCGYYPKTKESEPDDSETGVPPLTGRWEDEAGFSYSTQDQPVLWVAVFPDRDTAISAGRIMWPQMESGV